MLHAAAREGLLCPAYCLMPDHIHLVWMGLRHDTDQRNGTKFLRAQLGLYLKPAKFQHQPHDHVLKPKERQRKAFGMACADYVLLNPFKAGLVKKPSDWPYLGVVIPGYPRLSPFDDDYWPWFWKHYHAVRESASKSASCRGARWDSLRSRGLTSAASGRTAGNQMKLGSLGEDLRRLTSAATTSVCQPD